MTDQNSGTGSHPPASFAAQEPPPAGRPTRSTAGYVDFFGPSPLGCMIGGWISNAWDRDFHAPDIELCIDDKVSTTHASMIFYHRPDVGTAGHGFIMVLPAHATTGATLGWIRLSAPSGSFTLIPAVGTKRLADDAIMEQARASFGSSPVSGDRNLVQQLQPRPPGTGEALESDLLSSVFLVIEETYQVPPAGIVLRGWFFDPAGVVRSIRIHGNGTQHILRPDDWVRLPRPDVAKTIASPQGQPGEDCGFLAYAPDVLATDGSTHVEFETTEGERAYKHVPLPHKQGLVAIEALLSGLHLRHDSLRNGFDNVLGPAIAAINAQRIAIRPRVRPLQYGPRPDTPRCSIIVPLYGRVDFMEDQLAAAAASWAGHDEIIYVLDDPRRLRETETLAHTCYERFKVPFLVLCLDKNMGYAPANNIGLLHARGQFVCLLNSDVIPKEPRWLDHMIAPLASDSRIGVVGALLLFEDGTVQHEGCRFVSFPELANWHFPRHVNKGLLPKPAADVQVVEMVTGACIVMDRTLLLEIGGLDEGYVIGDFEDADLCRTLQARGLRAVIDRRAVLYHLERQSQDTGKNAWRFNLTMFNAWRHAQRWHLGAGQTRDDGNFHAS